ncbi:unnamed protein product, partial [Ectocarpus sp. 8 AP-2014]
TPLANPSNRCGATSISKRGCCRRRCHDVVAGVGLGEAAEASAVRVRAPRGHGRGIEISDHGCPPRRYHRYRSNRLQDPHRSREEILVRR